MPASDLKTCGSILAIGLLLSPSRAYAGERTGWDARRPPGISTRGRRNGRRSAGADRGQAADKVSCLSCHTTVSYALGRPALRRARGREPPDRSMRPGSLEQVRRRVAHWGELDTPRFRLSYDFDEPEEGRIVGHRGHPQRAWSWPMMIAAAASTAPSEPPGKRFATSGRPSTRTGRMPARGTGSTSASVPGRPARPATTGRRSPRSPSARPPVTQDGSEMPIPGGDRAARQVPQLTSREAEPA